LELDRVVIVGASLAGLAAASALRDGGWTGHLVVVDAAPELPTDRPPLSKQVLAGVMDPAAAHQPLANQIDALDLDLRFGMRVDGFGATDLRLKFANDHELSADGVVIASGATPRWPAGLALPEAGVHVIRDLGDALALRSDLAEHPGPVVLIGAGFIGAEVAATLAQAGREVVMVEAAPAPMMRVFPREVGDFVANLHRANGVEVRTGVGLAGIEGAERVSGVVLSDGSRIAASVVVLALGADPSVGWLEGSGLKVDNGVVCDETLWAAEGVVAAGDVCSWVNPAFGERMRVEHWDNAVEQGGAAGRRLLAAWRDETPAAFSTIPWFWSDQYGVKIQMAGRPAGTDELVVIDGAVGEERFAVAFRRDGECTGVLAVDRPRIAVMSRMRMSESRDWSHVVPS
jgi:NADPH-dependent 2,4-dienoyl-CoA reductase/sulfur reductase-like enzyme